MNSPRQQIEAFLSGYHDRWQQNRDDFRQRGVDHERWKSDLSELADEQLATMKVVEKLSLSYSYSRCPFDPESMDITDERTESGTAVVHAKKSGGDYVLFELKQLGDNWLITEVQQLLDPPDQPLLSSDQRRRLVELPNSNAPLPPLPDGVEPNGEILFEDGARIDRPSRQFELSVEPIGKLRTETGVLAASDFTAPPEAHGVLTRSIAPGSYTVEIAKADESPKATDLLRDPFSGPVAMRVVLRPDADVVEWVPADDTGSDGHRIGVDGGNVAIFDFEAYARLKTLQKRRLIDEFADSSGRPQILALNNGNRSQDRSPIGPIGECAISPSGWGDGTYPRYWGVDAEGNLAQLLVDFLVVADFLETAIGIDVELSSHLNGRPLSDPQLQQAGLEVRLDRSDTGDIEMKVNGDHKDWRLLDEDGEDVTPDERSVQPVDETTVYRWSHDLPKDDSMRIQFSFHAGYRN